MNELKNEYGNGLFNDGVFYFTNPTKEDWSTLWNNKEYFFPAMSTVPLVIANEPAENIQNIRKIFAKNLAQHVFHGSKEYQKMNKAGGLHPATYIEDDVLGATIQACLTPLPKAPSTSRQVVNDLERNIKASRPVTQGQDLNKIFEDYIPVEVGEL